MADETKVSTIPAPTLTLELTSTPPAAATVEAVVLEPQELAAPGLEDSLSAEERAQVDAFSQQIDVSNTTQILQYGAGAQQKMAGFSETALEKVRTQDLGEAGDLIAGVVTELKSFDLEEEKGIFGFFKK